MLFGGGVREDASTELGVGGRPGDDNTGLHFEACWNGEDGTAGVLREASPKARFICDALSFVMAVALLSDASPIAGVEGTEPEAPVDSKCGRVLVTPAGEELSTDVGVGGM